MQYAGAGIMYLIGKRLIRKHGYTAGPREALYEQATVWVHEGLAGRPYCGGDAPNLADLAVFGVLRAIEGLELRSLASRGSLFRR